jgi:YhgE/Pip-like protein
MRNAWKSFLKQPTTVVGIVTALMFQLIFGVIWMTGYDGVTDNVSRLTVAIVNEDAGIGKQVAENVGKNVPLQTKAVDRLEQAMSLLNEREVQMVMRIPADFSERLQTPGQTAELHYWINESNAMLVKNVMQQASSAVTAAVNREAVALGAQALLARMNVPDGQARDAAQQLAEKVTAKVEATNPVSGMNNQMLPMMTVLASFVGSMIMAMQLQQSSDAIGAAAGRWSKFAARTLINAVSAVVVALFGTSLVMALGGQAEGGFWAAWGFQSLYLFCFMLFAQLFVIAFGQAGMLFNIVALSAQLVSSGAMVPRELLSGFYRELGRFLPATYAVEGNMNLLFGGPGLAGPAAALALIAIGCLALGTAAAAIRKEKSVSPEIPGKLAS